MRAKQQFRRATPILIFFRNLLQKTSLSSAVERSLILNDRH